MSKKRLTPIKAIRQKCIVCSAGSLKDVRECTVTNCPLYPYRMGKNSYNSKDVYKINPLTM